MAKSFITFSGSNFLVSSTGAGAAKLPKLFKVLFLLLKLIMEKILHFIFQLNFKIQDN
jgi:hypothetical protein